MGLILAIDDDPDLLALISSTLQTMKHRVITAGDGVRGVDLAESGNPDLVLLDLSLPELDGFKVLQRLKNSNRTSAIPVLCLTASGDRDSVLRARRMGADEYMLKPFKAPELLKKVATHVRTGHVPKKEPLAVQRVPGRTTIVFQDSPARRGLKEADHLLKDGFLMRIRTDVVVLDISPLPEMTAEDSAALKLVINRLTAGGISPVVMAGRHTGILMATSDIADEYPCFITGGDLEAFIEAQPDS